MARAAATSAAACSPLAAARSSHRPRAAPAAGPLSLAPLRPVQPRLPKAPCARSRPLLQRVAAKSDGLDDILAKYGSSGGAQRKPAPAQRAGGGMGNGLFAILALNFGLFAGSNLLHLPALSASVLALNHWAPQWWQVRQGEGTGDDDEGRGSPTLLPPPSGSPCRCACALPPAVCDRHLHARQLAAPEVIEGAAGRRLGPHHHVMH